MGYIQAEVGLEFNNTASPDQIPQADVVAETLRVAVNNTNNNFNLSIDPASIKVIRRTIGVSTTNAGSTSSSSSAPTGGSTTIGGSSTAGGSTTSRGPMTTVASMTPGGSTTTGSSAATGGSTAIGLSTTVGGSSTSHGQMTTVVSITPGGSPSISGSTTNPGSTITGSSSATGGSTTAGPLVPTDGSVTSLGTTSPGGSDGAVTTTPPPVFVLGATLEEPFVEEFNNPSSVQYRNLEIQIVTVCDIIYRARYGFLFIRTFVIRFRRVVARTRMETTQADIGLEFNNTASPNQIPQANNVVKTLQLALMNPNNTFNLTLDTNSIEIIRTPNMTSSSTTATAASTTAVTSVATTNMQLIKRRLTFRSAGETFTSDLLNPASLAFINRAAMIKSMLEPFYQKAFSSFRSLTVISFRNGSIINTMDLGFASTSVPNDTQIADVLAGAASNITAFNIDTTSIIVDGIQVSSGVSHKISFITASFLVLLSWLLSSQQLLMC